jgi:LEA14-like dessication related protein
VTACAPLKPVEFRSVTNLKVENALLAPHVTADLNFFNPNSVGATIKDFQIDVALSQTPLTTVSFQKQKLPSNSEFSLPLNTSISYTQLIKFIPLGLSSFQSGKDIPVDLKGNITIKKFLYKKTFPFEYHDKINMKDIQIK